MNDKVTQIQNLEERTVRKVFWRLMPFLCLLYIVSFLDRVNVSYAALSMNKDLGFSNAVYGMGAGIFFIGYFVMEIPGNLIMARVGARFWVARILISWGIIASLTALVSTPHQFYLVRFFLGVAEASFFPGIIYYLGTWCRARDQARAVAIFMMSLPLCNVFGAPVSTWLLGIDWLGIAGWKWLFILEGIPAVILGIITPFYLTNRPADARWLTVDERNWLIGALAEETNKKVEKKKYTLWQAFTDSDVIKLTAVYFFWICGFYGLGLFLPILIKSLSLSFSNQIVGFLVAVPYIFAYVAMYLVGKNSDRTGERRWHTVFGMVMGAVGLGGSVLFAHVSIFVSMVFFTVSVMGIYASFGPFWAIPHSFLTASAAAGAIAMINSIGNFGGFIGPYAMGYIHDITGSFSGGLILLTGCLLTAAVLLISLRKSGQDKK